MAIGIESRFAAADKLVRAANEKGLDPEIAANYSKLGCVVVCGAVERSVEILITERIATRSPPQVGSFLKSYFRRGTNYDCEELEQLLFKLDKDWGHKFRTFVQNNSAIKESISSCYATPNSIAHGGGQSLGPRALKQYFDASLTLIAEVENILST